MSFERVSQKDIAARAGVHITTVSLALRDSPRLPEETRIRIRQLAEEMGYSPDPMLSALTAYRKSAKVSRYQGTLAWLNTIPKAEPDNLGYKDGAIARCAELGYVLEEFRVADMPLARISRVLRARNITGIFLPPQPGRLAHINFDWENFSAISFGYSLARPRLHVVTNAQYRSVHIAIRAMRARGYRRIGFATVQATDIRTDRNFSSGYLAEQRRYNEKYSIPMFIYDDVADATRRDFIKHFGKWYAEHKPDSILSLDGEISGALASLGIDAKTCGHASLMTSPSGDLAGVYQNGPMIGRTAVDFLVGMIHRNERGIPPVPLYILVDSTWRDAPSLPDRRR